VRIAREEEVAEGVLETLIANAGSRKSSKALDGATPNVNPVRVKPPPPARGHRRPGGRCATSRT
jgi:hypothetical protein